MNTEEKKREDFILWSWGCQMTLACSSKTPKRGLTPCRYNQPQKQHSSFPVIQKIDNFGIIAQPLMETNWNSWQLNQFKCKFTFAMVLWSHIDVTDFSTLLNYKYKQYKNANIGSFVYHWKTPMEFWSTYLIVDLSTTNLLRNGNSLHNWMKYLFSGSYPDFMAITGVLTQITLDL